VPYEIGEFVGTLKAKTFLQGPLLGFSGSTGRVVDAIIPWVDGCQDKYTTVDFEFSEPSVVFQLGESHEQTIQTKVELIPEWSHLPVPNPKPKISFVFTNDLAQLDVASLKFTASTSDPTKVGIDYANSPNRVQIHTRQVSAFIEGFEATTTVTHPVEIQVLPTCQLSEITESKTLQDISTPLETWKERDLKEYFFTHEHETIWPEGSCTVASRIEGGNTSYASVHGDTYMFTVSPVLPADIGTHDLTVTAFYSAWTEPTPPTEIAQQSI